MDEFREECGHCKAPHCVEKRWSFNQDTDECVEFVVRTGGCPGNKNSFKSSDECSKVCGGTPSVPPTHRTTVGK